MKTSSLTMSGLVALMLLPQLAHAQQLPARTGVSANVAGPVVDARTVARLRCAVGTGTDKQCAKFGFTLHPRSKKTSG